MKRTAIAALNASRSITPLMAVVKLASSSVSFRKSQRQRVSSVRLDRSILSAVVSKACVSEPFFVVHLAAETWKASAERFWDRESCSSVARRVRSPILSEATVSAIFSL